MKRFGLLLAVAGSAAIASCTRVGGDPNDVVAIVFDSLPYPAVVAGDTLRDELGALVFLRATALNPEGDAIPDAPISFLVLDAGATISEDGVVTSTDPGVQSVRIIAEADGLQSRPLTLFVTPSPDSMAQDGTVPTLEHRILGGTGDNTSGPVAIRLFNTSVDPPVTARGWIVRYSVEFHGTPVEVATSTRAWLVDDANRRSAEDTASADGRTSRRLRIVPAEFGSELADVDSIVVIATSTYLGLPLKGSPVRAVIQLRPAGTQ